MNLKIDGVYEDVFNQLRDGVYFVDKRRKITFWNRAAERISGYSKTRVAGFSCRDNILMHVTGAGESLCWGECPLAKTIQDGAQREAHVYLHHADGHRVPVMVRVTPVFEDGVITGAVEIFTEDINLAAALTRIETLEKESMLDPLTEIGNRRYTSLVLEANLREWQNRNASFGILFVDVDHFKAINDAYGHETGDRVIKMVTATLSSNLRVNDFAGRWGGEEFIVLVAGSDSESLKGLAERLRILVEHSYLTLSEQDSTGHSNLGVTVSIGGTIVRAGDTLETLVERADNLMYQSKRDGRNRVIVAE
jgi:diguanylate cyclase (GGDEF)-like protein/PAS domain S-box-containing protein